MKLAQLHLLRLCLAALLWSLVPAGQSQLVITRQFAVNQDLDDFPGQYEDARSISLGNATVTDLKVRLDLGGRSASDPGYNGDLYVTLAHSSGFAVLLNRPGKGTGSGSITEFGYPDNGFNVTLSDAATQNIHQYRQNDFSVNESGQLTGLWQPDGRNVNPLDVLGSETPSANLSVFAGLPVDGQWKLLLRDFAQGGVHTLLSWGLSISVDASTSGSWDLDGLTLESSSLVSDIQRSLNLLADITLEGGGAQRFQSSIAGPGGLVKRGPGVIELNAPNTFAGRTQLHEGLIRLGDARALQNSTLDLRVDNGIDFNGHDGVLGGLAGPGALDTGTGRITVGNNNLSTVYSGRLSGTGALVKSGLGALELTGQSAFSGNTVVQEGVLKLSGSLANSPLEVRDRGRLVGGGSTGPLTVHHQGTVSPGSSPGTLQSGGTVEWGPQGVYAWEINQAGQGNATPQFQGADPGWDHWQIDGNLTITATSADRFRIAVTSLTLANAGGAVHDFDSARDYQWVILKTSTGISGFSADVFYLDLAEFSNGLDGGTFAISQNGNDLFLNFTAIPEPHILALAAAVSLVGWAVGRKFNLFSGNGK